MSTIDNRVVELQFNNSDFMQKVEQTSKGLDQLKMAVNFDGVKTNLSGVASDMGAFEEKTNLVAKAWEALKIVAVGALLEIGSTITRSVGNAIDTYMFKPLRDGFAEYEQKMSSVQTILANTRRHGTELSEVTAVLDELNFYADKTVYNFGDMVSAIGAVTIAGIKVEDATEIVKGFGNAAAQSGASAADLNGILRYTSDAFSRGYFTLMDWRTMMNRGMGGKNVQEELAQLAQEMGVLNAKSVDAKKIQEDFQGTLKDGWLTADVMSMYLKAMTGDYTAAELAAMGMSETLAAKLYESGQVGLEAATKIRTFTALIGTLQEVAGSSWTGVWEAIVGDFDQATELFTGLGELIEPIVTALPNAIEKVVTTWKSKGGYEDLIQGFKNLHNAVMDFVKPVQIALERVFGTSLDDAGAGIASFSKRFREWTEGLLTPQRALNNQLDDMAKKLGVNRSELEQMWRDLKTGNKTVDDLASSLGGVAREFEALAVDGLFGPLTTSELQRQLGVAVNGAFGPETIKAVQEMLGVKVDGLFGPETKKAYQEYLGVTVDGIFGPQSIKALQEKLNNDSKLAVSAAADGKIEILNELSSIERLILKDTAYDVAYKWIDIFTSVKEGVGLMVDVIKAGWGVIRGFFSTVGDVIGVFLGGSGAKLLDVVQNWSKLFTTWARGIREGDSLKDTFTKTKTALAPIVAIAESLRAKFDLLWAAIKPVAVIVKDVLLVALNLLWNVLKSVYEFLSGVFSKVWDLVGEKITKVSNKITEWANGVTAKFKEAGDSTSTFTTVMEKLGSAFDKVMNFMRPVYTFVKDSLVSAFTTIKNLIEPLIPIIGQAFGAAWEFAKDRAGAFWDWLGPKLTSGIAQLGEFFTAMSDRGKTDGIVGVFDVIGESISTFWNGVIEAFGGGETFLGSALQNITTFFRDLFNVDSFGGFGDFLSRTWTNFKNEISGFLGWLRDSVSGAMDAGKESASGIANWMKTFFGSMNSELLLSLANLGILWSVIKGIQWIVTQIKKPFSQTQNSLTGMLDSVKGFFTTMKTNITATNVQNATKMFIAIGATIAALAYVAYKLGSLDRDQLNQGIGAVAALVLFVGAIMFMIKQITKTEKGINTVIDKEGKETWTTVRNKVNDFTGMLGIIGTLLAVGILIKNLTDSVRTLGEMDTDALIKGVAGVVGLMVGIAVILRSLKDNKLQPIKMAATLGVIAGGIWLIFKVMQQFEGMDPEYVTSVAKLIGALLVGLAALFAAIGLMMNVWVKIEKNRQLHEQEMEKLAQQRTKDPWGLLKIGAMLILIAVAIGVVIAALHYFPVEGELRQIVGIMGIVVAALAALGLAAVGLNNIPVDNGNNQWRMLAIMPSLAAALLLAAGAMRLLSDVEYDKGFENTLIWFVSIFGGLVLVMGALMKLDSSAKWGSAMTAATSVVILASSLVVVAGAIWLLTKAIEGNETGAVNATVVLGFMLIALGGVALALLKFAGDVKNAIAIAASVVILSGSLLVIATALAGLSEVINRQGDGGASAGMAMGSMLALLGALGGVAAMLLYVAKDTKNAIAIATSVVILSGSLIVIAGALAGLATVIHSQGDNGSAVANAMMALMAMLGALAIVSGVLLDVAGGAKEAISVATAVVLLSASLLPVAAALWLLSDSMSKDPGAVVGALIVLLAVLTALTLVAYKLEDMGGDAKSAQAVALSVLMLTTALIPVAAALWLLSTQPWEGMAAAGIAIMAVLAGMAALSKFLNKEFGGSKSAILAGCGAILVLAAGVLVAGLAIVALTHLPSEKMVAAGVALLAVLAGMAAIAKMLSTDVDSWQKAAIAMIPIVALCAALIVAATSIKMLAGFSMEEMMVAVGGMVGVFFAFALIATTLTNNFNTMDKALTMVVAVGGLAASMLLIAASLKLLENYDMGSLGASVLALVVVFMAMTAVANTLVRDGDNLLDAGAKALAMVGLAAAVVLVAVALRALGDQDFGPLMGRVLALVAVLAALLTAAYLFEKIPGDSVKNAGSMVLLAAAAVAVAVALLVLGQIDMDKLLMSVLALGLVIAALVVASKVTGTGGTVALVGIAATIAVMAAALMLLASVPMESLLAGFIALAAIITVLTVAIIALHVTGALGVLTAFTASLGTLVLGIAAGVLAIAVLVTAITAFTALVAYAPGMIVAGFDQILKGMQDLAPKFEQTGTALGKSLLNTISNLLPDLLRVVDELVTGVLNLCANKAWDWFYAIGVILGTGIGGIFAGIGDSLAYPIALAADALGFEWGERWLDGFKRRKAGEEAFNEIKTQYDIAKEALDKIEREGSFGEGWKDFFTFGRSLENWEKDYLYVEDKYQRISEMINDADYMLSQGHTQTGTDLLDAAMALHWGYIQADETMMSDAEKLQHRINTYVELMGTQGIDNRMLWTLRDSLLVDFGVLYTDAEIDAALAPYESIPQKLERLQGMMEDAVLNQADYNVEGLAQRYIEMGGVMPDSMVEGYRERLPGAENAIKMMTASLEASNMESLNQWRAIAIEEGHALGREEIQAIVDAMKDNEHAVQDAMNFRNSLLENGQYEAAQTFTRAWNDANEGTGSDLAMITQAALEASKTQAFTSSEEWAQAIMSATEELPEEMREQIRSSMTAAVEQIEAAVPEAEAASNGILNGIIGEGGLGGLTEGMGEIGTGSVQELVDGMHEAQPEADKETRSVMETLTEAAKAVFVEHGPDVAEEFVSTVATEIANKAGTLEDASDELAKDAIEKAKTKMGLEGPSVGREMDQKAASGLGNAFKLQVEQWARDAVNAAKNTINNNASTPPKGVKAAGQSMVESFSEGIVVAAHASRNTNPIVEALVDGLQYGMAMALDILEHEGSLHPVITPVLDLNEIEKGNGRLVDTLTRFGMGSMSRATGLQRMFASDYGENSRGDNSESGPDRGTTFIQNNYSPQRLSAAELYRQTRNQLAMANQRR